jgi:hypothetical protein
VTVPVAGNPGAGPRTPENVPTIRALVMLVIVTDPLLPAPSVLHTSADGFAMALDPIDRTGDALLIGYVPGSITSLREIDTLHALFREASEKMLEVRVPATVDAFHDEPFIEAEALLPAFAGSGPTAPVVFTSRSNSPSVTVFVPEAEPVKALTVTLNVPAIREPVSVVIEMTPSAPDCTVAQPPETSDTIALPPGTVGPTPSG